MRQIDRIRVMSLTEIAPYLIKRCFPYDENDDKRWLSPSGKKFTYYDDAIEDCIKWLDSEFEEIV